MTDPCPTCTNEPGWIVRPVDPPGVTLPGGAIRTERVPCPDCASPQPDTGTSALEEACRVLDEAFPGVDLGDVSDVLGCAARRRAAPAGR